MGLHVKADRHFDGYALTDTRCIAKAKALRKAKRDAESQKPVKVPKLSEKTRKKMAESASERWDKYRAKTGKRKYERS